MIIIISYTPLLKNNTIILNINIFCVNLSFVSTSSFSENTFDNFKGL